MSLARNKISKISDMNSWKYFSGSAITGLYKASQIDFLEKIAELGTVGMSSKLEDPNLLKLRSLPFFLNNGLWGE